MLKIYCLIVFVVVYYKMAYDINSGTVVIL